MNEWPSQLKQCWENWIQQAGISSLIVKESLEKMQYRHTFCHSFIVYVGLYMSSLFSAHAGKEAVQKYEVCPNP